MSEKELAAMPNEDVDVKSRILTIRGVQVMLDRDFAELYGVELKALNQAVKRNAMRFPERFMHQLSKEEFVTSSWGGVRKPPKVFTEQGISMLSAVLHTQTAVQVSIRIMDAFVAMRRFLQANGAVLQRLEMVEMKQLTMGVNRRGQDWRGHYPRTARFAPQGDKRPEGIWMQVA